MEPAALSWLNEMFSIISKQADVPIVVPLEDGRLFVICIPRMSAEEFDFFLYVLELYKSAIVIPDKMDGGDGASREVDSLTCPAAPCMICRCPAEAGIVVSHGKEPR